MNNIHDANLNIYFTNNFYNETCRGITYEGSICSRKDFRTAIISYYDIMGLDERFRD